MAEQKPDEQCLGKAERLLVESNLAGAAAKVADPSANIEISPGDMGVAVGFAGLMSRQGGKSSIQCSNAVTERLISTGSQVEGIDSDCLGRAARALAHDPLSAMALPKLADPDGVNIDGRIAALGVQSINEHFPHVEIRETLLSGETVVTSDNDQACANTAAERIMRPAKPLAP